MAGHCAAMVEFQERGADVFDYGNSLRAEARTGGFEALRLPRLRPAYVRPLFCRARARSAGPRSPATPTTSPPPTPPSRSCSPGTLRLQRWLELARSASRSRACRRASAGSATASATAPGCASTSSCASGEVSAPIVIGRDHLDSGSVASPYRETEGMQDGSDAIADWPILNALLNAASGAAWVAVHHGGGVGIGRSIHAGAQVVADGTADGALRVERVLTNDPGTGVMRHADAGYADGDARRRASAASTCRCCVSVLLVPDLRARPGDGVRAGVAVELDGGHDRRGRPLGGRRGAQRRRAAARAAARARSGQRALARLPAAPARPGRARGPAARRTTSGPGARPCTPLRTRSTPSGCATVGAACFGAGRARRLHDRGRVPLRPPPARRHALRGAERARARGHRGRARRRRAHRAAARRIRARRSGTRAERGPAALLRSQRRGVPRARGAPRRAPSPAIRS